MSKQSNVIDQNLKLRVDAILANMGLSSHDAISLFYQEIDERKDLPFSLKTPNAQTVEAIEDVRSKQNLHSACNADDLFRQLGIQ